jgi:ABC-type Zn uptake system ZnuABC Zn-binding protein ZnuA
MLKLQKADVIIANGLGLETNLEKALTRFSTKLVIASTLVDKKMLLNDLDEPSQGNPNPHIWTSPALLTQIIIGLSNDLGKRYPMHKDAIAANARKTIMELNQVDSKIKLEKDRYPKATIVTLHDAFVYFFEYFKIDYIGSIQPSAGKDPAPKQLSDLADKVKANHIKSIYIEPQMNPKPAETLATELNLKVLKYDDLGTTLSAKTISEYLWQNWLSFKAGF